jgi:signal-transduction protein with cAMP-binding, CBS, and nucleotidyltransferase domain
LQVPEAAAGLPQTPQLAYKLRAYIIFRGCERVSRSSQGRTRWCRLLSIGPTTTVGDAMQLITERRFRHLPIVDDGKVLAVVSSGDLTHWLVQDQMGEVKELVELAGRS